jgi:hypothetical protein
MAYTKYSLTPANNNAAPPDGAPEGMLPSAVNDTMRDMMAQIRDVGDGIRGGTYTMTAPIITGGTITGVALTGNTFTSPVISGGSINNTPIGATTASTGAFSTLSATGVTTVQAGSVSAPAITTTGDTNTGIFFPAADTIAFTEGGVESMRIDSSGNVGIGTTSTYSAYAKLHVLNGIALAVDATNGGVVVGANTSGTELAYLSMGRNYNLANAGEIALATNTAKPILFGTNSAERMRIDSSGNLLVGTTGISTGTFKGIQNAAGGAGANFLSRNSSGTAGRQWNFGMNSSDEYVVYGHNGTSFNTGAYIAWGGTSWTAQSDERSKDIIEPITDAANKVSTLRAVIGKYKTDEEGTRRSFLIAQDVQAVLPEAVDASKPDNLGVQYTEVIPLLVAAIKELKATVDAQAARIAALESK